MVMKRNRVLLISNISAGLVILFELMILYELFFNKGDAFAALFTAIIAIFLIPSLVLMLVGLLFGILAYKKNNRWLTLSASILYLLGAIVLFQFGIFMVPTFILSITAYIIQVKQVRKSKNEAAQLLP